MRAIWTGAISFGLVNIPIRLYSATDESSISFHMLHSKDHSPIRFARVCKECGKEVAYADIVKGYETAKGEYVVMEAEDFEKANPRKTKTIDIMDFAGVDEVDTVYFEKPYYLEPSKGAEKPYALLREALKKSKKVGIARYVLRNKESLAVIKPDGDVIVLNQLRFDQEVRDYKDLKIPQSSVNKKEVDMALALIEQLTKPFKPKEYKDTYAADLQDVIKQKAKGKTPKRKGKAPTPTKVNDLMSLLRKSLDKEKKKAA